MTSRTAAARYGRALFDVALKEADPRQVERELETFVALVEGHAALERALLSPVVPVAHKRAVVESVLRRGGGAGPVAKLLVMLAERDRVSLLPLIRAAYRRRLQEHLNIVEADVTIACALSAERVRTLEQGLANATGKQVKVAVRVDPTIIGGIVARMGSVVYDGSVTRQLERLRERLVSEG